MKKITLLIFICFLLWPKETWAQEQDTTLFGQFIPEIIFAEDKNENERLFTPTRVNQISIESIELYAPNTSADLLQKEGNIMIQMSQSGGGSPIIRGFEANRILLVVDGIRLNNAIYRSGHLQNSISISPLTLENVDVIFGPSSVKYGSDALGGVVHYHTQKAKTNNPWKGKFLQRYASANEGVNLYFDHQWGGNKWGYYQAINLQHFGNLSMGKNRLHGYQQWGKEAHITKGNEQLGTSYEQVDLVQKLRYNINKRLSINMNVQLSSTNDINRFDQLNDISDGLVKFEQWYYGPQKRALVAIGTEYQNKTALFDSFNNTLSFQRLVESRNSKKPNQQLIQRQETVLVYSNTTDFIKKWGYKLLNYGVDIQYNMVESTASTGSSSRYADGGSQLHSLSIYSQYKHPLNSNSFISGGLRYNNSQLGATFKDTETYNLPFNNIKLNNEAVTSSIGLFASSLNGWEGHLSFATGFRSPNVDDVTKVFAKSGRLTVPNKQLTPEFSKNIEVSLGKKTNDGSYLEATYYYTLLQDAIIKAPFILNGQDSLLYDGEWLPLYANTNSKEAYIYGYSIQGFWQINTQWSTKHSCSYTFGRDKTTDLPLDHIPPFYGKSQLDWQSINSTFKAGFYVCYNAWKPIEDYSPNGSDNPEEATEDGNPSWWTLNMNYSLPINDKLSGQLNIENLLDVHYKTYSSGISAPGRNIIITLIAQF